MSENKSIDGIKKLSKDEVKKARKILLDYIGEDSKKKDEVNAGGREGGLGQEKVPKPKNMDGILSGINFKKRESREKKEHKKTENTKKEREALKKELGFTDKVKEVKDEADKNIGGAFLRMAEKSEKKKKKEINRKSINERRNALELKEDRKAKVKKELEDKRKKIIEEKQVKEEDTQKTLKIKEELEKEKKHLEKIKKEKTEKKKRKKIEDSLAEIKKREKEKKEKKKRIKKKIKLFKHKAHKRILDTWLEIKERRKKIVISILLLIISSLLIYLFFVVILVRFNPDNKVSRFIADFMPVPALISSSGALEYYDYIDKKSIIISELNVNDPASINKVFALDFVLNSLVKKYNINYRDENFKAQVEQSLLTDLDVNNVAIKRIGKIKSLIEEGGNFVQVSEKYGDQVDKVDFKNEEEALESFGSSLAGLRIDEVSDIVVHSDGYYIFKRYKKNNTFSLSYVYISSVTLDEYLNEKATKLKIWSLVD
ncbi:MAG: hypothetical protein PF572_00725 [Patescibacteria group bacterium]|jgi:hypothetical protein|nr:hypothetical protein [Patescibacteria group bacterium]